ncbi:hypothetical protein L596_028603 [Steinernema carpocapsae]|uniref:Uncharacterized protein n=1 Tax=Steinernema carpocapsae TaxID=34508 RepID=A0A4U5LYX1_STECR|nr:hypothetical protein L596_028603 [Steinernema carpocapsae]
MPSLLPSEEVEAEVVADEPPNFSAEYAKLCQVRASLKPDSCVYSAEFVNCVRDFICKANNVQCLLTDEELIEFGLDKKSASPSQMRKSNRQDFKRGQKEPSRSTSKGRGRTLAYRSLPTVLLSPSLSSSARLRVLR